MTGEQAVGVVIATILICVVIAIYYVASKTDKKNGLDDIEKRYKGEDFSNWGDDQ